MSEKRELDDSPTTGAADAHDDDHALPLVRDDAATVAGAAKKARTAESTTTVTADAPAETTEQCTTTTESVKVEESSACAELELDPLDEKDEQAKEATTSSTGPKVTKLSTPSILIFGLHPLATQEKLEKLLQKYGDLEKLNIKMAFASRYALCEYKELSEAQTALETLHGRSLMKKSLIVKAGASASSA